MSKNIQDTLKLALEAFDDRSSLMKWQAARDAVKEALAQPEQKPVAWRWPYKFKDIGETGGYEYHSHEFACLAHLPKGEPLYTTPPQRTWVGLTDEEKIDLVLDSKTNGEMLDAIEAKLKGDNTCL